MRDPWSYLSTRTWPGRLRPRDPDGNLLRVDADAICPRCLSFVAPHEIVRRTAYGPFQHEHCPPAPATMTRLTRLTGG